jgi:hypothetical protein
VAIGLNGIEHVCSDLVIDQNVEIVFVVAQICEVSATLAVLFHIFSVFKHEEHELYGLFRSYSFIAVEDLGHMGKRGGCIKHSFLIGCCSS